MPEGRDRSRKRERKRESETVGKGNRGHMLAGLEGMIKRGLGLGGHDFCDVSRVSSEATW